MENSFYTGKSKRHAAAFWQWFIANESSFRNLENNDSEQALSFLDELIRQMEVFHPWLKALAGLYNDNTYELIITSDGDVSLFYKVEELVALAPAIEHWHITAHKPALGFEGISIELYGKEFSTGTTHFYPVIQEEYPDEVNIVITHTAYKPEEDEHFQAGGMIYLENGLGELNTATKIDYYETGPVPGPEKEVELIPVTKLHDYLNWREKEFVEKYESAQTEKPEEQYYLMEAQDNEGLPMVALVNAGYSEWPAKPAYPWMLQVDIRFQGDSNGLPFNRQLKELEILENEIIGLPGLSGQVHYLGNRTYQQTRSIYFYLAEYRTASRVLHHTLEERSWDYEISFSIRKDKYWHTMEIFFQAQDED